MTKLSVSGPVFAQAINRVFRSIASGSTVPEQRMIRLFTAAGKLHVQAGGSDLVSTVWLDMGGDAELDLYADPTKLAAFMLGENGMVEIEALKNSLRLRGFGDGKIPIVLAEYAPYMNLGEQTGEVFIGADIIGKISAFGTAKDTVPPYERCVAFVPYDKNGVVACTWHAGISAGYVVVPGDVQKTTYIEHRSLAVTMYAMKTEPAFDRIALFEKGATITVNDGFTLMASTAGSSSDLILKIVDVVRTTACQAYPDFGLAASKALAFTGDEDSLDLLLNDGQCIIRSRGGSAFEQVVSVNDLEGDAVDECYSASLVDTAARAMKTQPYTLSFSPMSGNEHARYMVIDDGELHALAFPKARKKMEEQI